MIIFQHRYCRLDLQRNPDVSYVFGDNEQRWGLGGQARETRGEPNAIGIATLKAPGIFWTEEDVARQCAVIDADLLSVILALLQNRVIIWPTDGIGTGLARLDRQSPTTFEHLIARQWQIRMFNRKVITFPDNAGSPSEVTHHILDPITPLYGTLFSVN